MILKSVARVFEVGEHLPRPDDSHTLAVAAERQLARPRYRAVLRAVGAAILVISITTAIAAIPLEHDEALGRYGYLGVFVITLVATGALVVPVPYLVVIGKAATVLDPYGVALVAGLAAALGELTAYLLGFSGRFLIGPSRWQRSADRWMRRHGFLTIVVMAFVPNPLFDAVGVAAGAIRYSVWRFGAACFLGKTAKFLLVALYGPEIWNALLSALRQLLTQIHG